MKLVIASSNAGKLAEFEHLLSDADWHCIAQSTLGVQDAEETGLTFVENALLKARNACAATGLPAIADDSGLCVDALNGAPGLYSARYAGEHGNAAANIELLHSKLKGQADRRAFFVCVIVFLRHAHDASPVIAEGRWHGEIIDAGRGELGFGYDPVFFDPVHQLTAAQMQPELKNRISHRGQAMRALRAALDR